MCAGGEGGLAGKREKKGMTTGNENVYPLHFNKNLC